MTDYLKQHPNDANARAIVEGIAKVLTDEVHIHSSLDEVPQVGRVQADDAPGFVSFNDGGYSIHWVMTVRDVLEDTRFDMLPAAVRASAQRSSRYSMEDAIDDLLSEFGDEMREQGIDIDGLRSIIEEDPYQAESLVAHADLRDEDEEPIDISQWLSEKVDEANTQNLMQFEVRLVHHRDDPKGEIHVAVMANDDSPYFRDNGDFFRQTGARHINPSAQGPEMELFSHDVMKIDELTVDVAEEVVDRFRLAVLHPSVPYEEVKAATSAPTP